MIAHVGQLGKKLSDETLLLSTPSYMYIGMTTENTDKASSTTTLIAPYVSFKTFQSGVQALRSHGLPAKIDRSVWMTKSGADQTALLSAFRFLCLIDSQDLVQPTLRKLADAQEASDAEKGVLGGILRTSYAKLFELNLETLTPTQFSEAIENYGPTGSTRERSERFFLKAAKHCGIKMSGRLKSRKPRATGSKGNGSNAQRSVRRTPGQQQQRQPGQPRQDEQAPKAMKEIELPQAGGKLTLSGTFNTFELVGDERDLVFKIIDAMKGFESKTEEDR